MDNMAKSSINITTIEMHTGGEPLRIITGGYPEVKGDTILDKRNYAREHLDSYRKLIIHEPRGHYDQYAALPVEPDLPDVDLAVLFLHNEGYSTMCGHAVIALGRYAVDYGLVKKCVPETRVRIQCPCGVVVANVKCTDTTSGETRFTSVPAFSMFKDIRISVPGFESDVLLDVAYGGAFYALVKDHEIGIDLDTVTSREIADIADRVSEATRRQVTLKHPEDHRLEYLYGTIVTRSVCDGHGSGYGRSTEDNCSDKGMAVTSNICVFANKEIDRSPTGSGVTARIAADAARGSLSMGQAKLFRNALTGSEFTGRWLSGRPDAGGVRVEVTGHAYYTGSSVFTLEPDDIFQQGFLLR